MYPLIEALVERMCCAVRCSHRTRGEFQPLLGVCVHGRTWDR